MVEIHNTLPNIEENQKDNIEELNINSSVLDILEIDETKLDNSFGKLIISQKLSNIDISKSKDELIDDIIDFWNSIIGDYVDNFDSDFKEENEHFWRLDFFIGNWVKEPLKNSFDSFVSADRLWKKIKWEISFNVYKTTNWITFIIRDNWAWKEASSTEEKKNNNRYIWGKGVWIWSLNTDWYWKECKSYYRVGKNWWAVTKVVLKVKE